MKKCEQCSKELKDGEWKTRQVVHVDQGRVKKTDFTVCKEGGCGGYLQMAYEG